MMRLNHITRLLALVASCLLPGAVLAQNCAPTLLPLSPNAGLVGVGGPVNALTRWDPDGTGPQPESLIAAGRVLMPQSTPMNIAAWDGRLWRSLNADFSSNFNILAMTSFQGKLIVAGQFTTVNNQPALNIASYDGQTWSAMGDGLRMASGQQATVRSLTIHNGLLYAAGSFDLAGSQPAASIASWDGTQWQPLPFTSTSPLPSINTTASFNDALIVGTAQTGTLTAVGLPGVTLGRWDGSAWAAASTTFMGLNINSMARDGTSLYISSSALYRLSTAGVLTNLITPATFNPSLVHRFAGGVAVVGETNLGSPIIRVYQGSNALVYATGDVPIAALGDWQGRLVAGGDFQSIGNVLSRNIALYLPTEQSWRSIGAGLQPVGFFPGINAAVSDAQFDYFGGSFYGIGGVYSTDFVRRSRTTGDFTAAASPVDLVESMQLLDLDGPGPEAPRVVVGLKRTNGTILPNGIKSFDGAAWRNEMNAVQATAGFNPVIFALATHQGQFIAGGDFLSVSGVPAVGIARRVNGVWQAMGSLPARSVVRDLRVVQGDLYAIGDFGTALGLVIRWTGTTWESTGLPTGTNVMGMRLTEYAGQLVASQQSGSDASVFTLRAGVWQPMGQTDFAAPLATIDGELFAGTRRWNGVNFVGTTTSLGLTPQGVITDAAGNRVYFGPSANPIYFRELRPARVTVGFNSPAQSVAACPDTDVTLSVDAHFTGTASFIWRRNGIALPEQGYLGARTTTLTLLNATPADAGIYDVVTYTPCGLVQSQPITLTVAQSLCTPICGDIDFNNNDVFPEEEDVIAFFRVLAGGNCTE
ncbi:MAG: hypothetical protein ACK5ZG_12725 [Phycisphaerae bacterium]